MTACVSCVTCTCVLLFFAYVIFLGFLRTFYFAFVLFLTQGVRLNGNRALVNTLITNTNRTNWLVLSGVYRVSAAVQYTRGVRSTHQRWDRLLHERRQGHVDVSYWPSAADWRLWSRRQPWGSHRQGSTPPNDNDNNYQSRTVRDQILKVIVLSPVSTTRVDGPG